MQALALAPDDPACLVILGRLRYLQANYDAALDALSRAANAEPKSAEVQNYLGITLSAKGLRGPAETALRKAIQLAPSTAKPTTTWPSSTLRRSRRCSNSRAGTINAPSTPAASPTPSWRSCWTQTGCRRRPVTQPCYARRSTS